MKSGEGRVVCVTGGSGYIASWLVKLLLQHGYTVHATLRDLNDEEKTKHMAVFEGAKERLKLFKADLVEEGSFDAAIDGCDGVFHTACPAYHINDAQAELIDPAVKGTINVLKSCSKFPSVKRVIITSSMASVMYNGKPLTCDVVIDETWSSDPSFCQTIQPLYMLAKTLAEEAAWKYAKENGIDIVTLHPGFTIGPYLQPTINVTVGLILKYLKGETFPNQIQRLVDVRDVAGAHIKAFEEASANGRYCLVGRVIHFSDFLNIVHQLYPTLPIPTKCEDEKPFVEKYEVSREKAKSLGVEFTPLEKTVDDTIELFKEKGFLK